MDVQLSDEQNAPRAFGENLHAHLLFAYSYGRKIILGKFGMLKRDLIYSKLKDKQCVLQEVGLFEYD